MEISEDDLVRPNTTVFLAKGLKWIIKEAATKKRMDMATFMHYALVKTLVEDMGYDEKLWGYVYDEKGELRKMPPLKSGTKKK